jgi:hypothetical protein
VTTPSPLLRSRSNAAALAAGVAALYLQWHPQATPAQVKQALVSTATPGVVTGVPAGDANLLLRCATPSHAHQQNRASLLTPRPRGRGGSTFVYRFNSVQHSRPHGGCERALSASRCTARAGAAALPPASSASTQLATLLGYAVQKLRSKRFRDFGWGVAHGAVTRHPPISLDTMVPRTAGYAYEVWGLGFVHHSRTILCRAVPNLRATIRNFSHRCT